MRRGGVAALACSSTSAQPAGAEVGQGAVASSVQGTARQPWADHFAAGLSEQVLGTLAGQPAPTRDRADPAWARASATSAMACACGSGSEMEWAVCSAALGADPGALVVRVQVADVQGEDLLGAGGDLVEHPPQGLLPQPDAWQVEQPLTGGGVDGAGAVDGFLAALQPGGRVDVEPEAAGGVGDERAEGGQVPVPGRGGRSLPARRVQLLQRVAVEARDRCGVVGCGQPVRRLGVGVRATSERPVA
jgi:hypothetical protein